MTSRSDKYSDSSTISDLKNSVCLCFFFFFSLCIKLLAKYADPDQSAGLIGLLGHIWVSVEYFLPNKHDEVNA